MANHMMMNNEGADERAAAVAATKTAEEAGGSRGGGGLKKGPWTTNEDAILVEYVRKHGEGNWNAVQKNSGLARCGKSCRLRWANHLRPNLKKGSFTPEEERIIIELHSKLGNKWARMASQLPGRTDNEIKNYWNTRMKRRQRAGLPLYPRDIPVQYHNDNNQRHSTSSSSSFSSQLLSPSHHHHHSPKLDNNNYTFHHHHSVFHSQPSDNSAQLFTANNSGFALPICSSGFPFGSSPSSSSALFNQRTHVPIPQTTLPNPSFRYNVPAGFSGSFGTLSSMGIGSAPYDPSALEFHHVPSSVSVNMVTELPSTQTTLLQSTTPTSSYTSGGGGGGGGGGDEFEFQESRGNNSGLLDALLFESQALSRNEKAKRKGSPVPAPPEKGKRFFRENRSTDEEEEEEEEEEEHTIGSESVLKNNGKATSVDNENYGRTENFSTSCQSSIGIEQSEEPLDDDLMSLLNNFPTSMPVPDWYGGRGGNSERENLGVTSGLARRVEDVVAQDSSLVPLTTTGKHERSLDSCYWNNMPGIC